uniref:hypermethylated in cancer 1 protein n=1 Tax=Euleptes europaea TaxID=460621 RepID=UPI0025424EC4|nr:hypermethylated in cancer 1 protein [Euleptes europaea]
MRGHPDLACLAHSTGLPVVLDVSAPGLFPPASFLLRLCLPSRLGRGSRFPRPLSPRSADPACRGRRPHGCGVQPGPKAGRVGSGSDRPALRSRSPASGSWGNRGARRGRGLLLAQKCGPGADPPGPLGKDPRPDRCLRKLKGWRKRGAGGGKGAAWRVPARPGPHLSRREGACDAIGGDTGGPGPLLLLPSPACEGKPLYKGGRAGGKAARAAMRGAPASPTLAAGRGRRGSSDGGLSLCALLAGGGGEGGAMLDASEPSGHSRQLLLQLNVQRTKGFLCDVIVVVQNALFRAHKNVLAASSAYLKALVVHDNLINLDQEMVSPAVFRAVLDFIYTGRLGEAEGEAGGGVEPSLGAVLAAASYLQIPDLVALCKKKLKRSGKYCQFRGGFPHLGKLPRGLRAATPVIQSCYSAPPPPAPPPPPPPRPVEPGNPLSTHCGELYAAASGQGGAALHPHGLCPPERLCSPLCGLDLSKKSPNGPALPPPAPSEGRLRESRENSLPPGGPDSPVLLPAHPSFGEPPSYRGSPGPEPSGRGEAPPPPEFLYRWMKHEPLVGGYVEDEDDDEEEGDCRGRRDKGGGAPGELERKAESPSQRRYAGLDGAEPDGEAEDMENDKSTSEETGCSSGGPSPAAGSLERYLGYEPESFGGDNLYVCIPCGKGFPSSEQLNAHVEAHNEEDELYRKEAAEAAGQGSPFLDKPLGAPPLLPSGAAGGGDLLRPYRCSSCEKAYKDPATLRQHEKTHWLTRPYPCSICGKKFTQRGTMTRHMRSHLGLKPFACDACGMRFTRQYRLTEHMRIHSGEKPYECQVCGGKFAQQRNLLSHMKMHAAAAAAAAAAASTGPDGKLKLDFPDGVLAMARLAQQQHPDKDLLASHFLAAADPKMAMESLYLGLSPDKAAEVLAQGAAAAAAAAAAHLHNDHHARTIDRFSPP